MTEQQITETEEVEPVVDEELSDENVQKSDGDLDTTEGTDADLMDDHEKEDEQDSFPREYVEKLRDESARYRQRAQRADDLAHRLHKTLVESTGRLMDADDLEFDEKHLDDPEALTAAIDELLEDKPYLAKRTPKGSVGQGESGASTTVDLAGILRSRA
ncbi:MAG: hypothetical protein ACQEVD_16190 [Actinomycetota bacterium]